MPHAIPRNLILGQQFTQLYTGTRIDYIRAERSVNSTADKVEFFHRRIRSFALHEILTSTGHQVVLVSNRVLLAISVSIFPVEGTLVIKIAPFYFIA